LTNRAGAFSDYEREKADLAAGLCFCGCRRYWPFTNEQWVEALFHVPELFTTAHFGACFQLCRLSTLRPSGPTSLCSGPARKALPHCASLRDRRAFLHVKTALTLAILQTYDCAVLRWPFEELRPKGRPRPSRLRLQSPSTWIGAVGGRFFVLGIIGAELIEASEC
jgi:hypothetical protein